MDTNNPHPTQTPATPRPRSRWLRYTAIAAIVLISPIFALAATVAATGTVTVKVAEHGPDGVNLYIPVPALVFDLALFAAPMVMPEDALDEARAELAPYREGLDALAAELADMPAGVLVEVESDGEHVRVEKTWRSFEIKVESSDADVTVSVPARVVASALKVL